MYNYIRPFLLTYWKKIVINNYYQIKCYNCYSNKLIDNFPILHIFIQIKIINGFH